MKVTIKSGLNALTVDLANGTSVGELLANPNFAAVLGYEAGNSEVFASGVKLDSGVTLVDGDEVTVQQKAHCKA